LYNSKIWKNEKQIRLLGVHKENMEVQKAISFSYLDDFIKPEREPFEIDIGLGINLMKRVNLTFG